MCRGVTPSACVLPANDQCFRDLLPSFSTLLSVSLFALPSLALSPLILSFTLLFLPPPPPPPPLCVLLRRPTPGASFKQPALSAADTSSMQIESPPASLSHSFPVLLFSLPFRYYVVMRVSCLYSETSLTLPFFCFHICSLPHVLSCCRSLVLSSPSSSLLLH